MKSLLHWAPIASGFLVLVLSMFVAVLTVSQRNSSGNLANTQSLSTKASVSSASLSLSPASGSYDFSPTASYPLGIVLDTRGKSIDGVDVLINFDSNKAQVVGSKVSTTALFEEFPQNVVDNVKGQIRFSALTFDAKPKTGIVGTFTFKPRSVGQVDFNFEYTFGSTKDSNVADHDSGKDILGEVSNGSYSFR